MNVVRGAARDRAAATDLAVVVDDRVRIQAGDGLRVVDVAGLAGSDRD
jgi:hypothetical protein